MKPLAGAILALFLTNIAFAEKLSLEQALSRALGQNRAIATLKNAVLENDERIGQSLAAFKPQFRLNASYSYLSRLPELKLDVPVSFKLPELKTGTHNLVDANLSAAYLLFDWGKRDKVFDQVRLGRQLSLISLQGGNNEVAYQLMEIYFTSALFAEKMKLSEKYVEISNRHLEDVKTKYASGLVSQFDLLKSEMQLKAYQEQLVIVQSDLQVALLSLTEVIGGEAQELFLPAEGLEELTIIVPRQAAHDSLLKQKPQVRALQNQQERARLTESVERLRPTLNLVSSAGWKNSYLQDPDKPLFNFLGGVSVTFPLYDGGYSQHRRAEEREKINTLQLEIDRLTSESRRHLEILFQEMRKIEAKLKITAEKLALARKALEIASVSYGTGLIANTEYLDTELDVRVVEIESLQDRYSQLMIQLELKKELGYFPEALAPIPPLGEIGE